MKVDYLNRHCTIAGVEWTSIGMGTPILEIAVPARVSLEPFGLASAEGFGCGRAIIANDGEGTAEKVHARRAALLHHHGYPRVLAIQIARLPVDANIRRRLVRPVRPSAVPRCTRRLATELTSTYRSIVAEVAA
jgi:hypothetical protein